MVRMEGKLFIVKYNKNMTVHLYSASLSIHCVESSFTAVTAAVLLGLSFKYNSPSNWLENIDKNIFSSDSQPVSGLEFNWTTQTN